MDFIEELRWRGLLYDFIPETDQYLKQNHAAGYIGFDPTSASLGIGNLIQILILKHFQRAGHQPIALLGGATGMIGDPSGKTAERNLLDQDTLEHNVNQFRQQLEAFFTASEGPPIQFVNNYEWYRDMDILYFLREVGKHLTVNYMMAKDSVKSRLESGISFTEFSYQLLQAYDFYKLYEQYGCRVQMGGSDQWGNLTAGVELIRRLGQEEEAYAVTSPLVTKADGSKFGKSEKGNIYLDRSHTSPYEFYQFWLNVSDEDAERFVKMFTFLNKAETDQIIEDHREAPHQRLLQQRLAEEVTKFVHSEEDLKRAQEASKILFGKSTLDQLQGLDEETLLSAMADVPQFEVPKKELEAGIPVLDLLTHHTTIQSSRSEAKKSLKSGAITINKHKKPEQHETLDHNELLKNRYMLIQVGKKRYHLLKAS